MATFVKSFTGSDSTTIEMREEPKQDVLLSASPEVLSKDLVIRHAHLDNRARDGHRNAVVFLLEMKRTLISSTFTACRVGSTVSSRIHFRKPIAYKRAIRRRHVTKNRSSVARGGGGLRGLEHPLPSKNYYVIATYYHRTYSKDAKPTTL